MTNLLDLVPSLDRHLRVYRNANDTDSKLAGYLADSIEALGYFWGNKSYVIDFTPPMTYVCNPDIALNDKRPIILMGSIIYKMGNLELVAITDGDFSYNPFPRGKGSATLEMDVDELDKFLPKNRLAMASAAPMRGFNNVFNINESHDWTALFSLFT